MLQTYARKTNIAIDDLAFSTELQTEYKEGLKEVMPNGLVIYGLFIQGASWDVKGRSIIEPKPGELWMEMPCIWLKPILKKDLKKNGYYECPLYKTSRRAGELSTTGHSTNFVMYIYLQTKEDPDHWIRRGTALLTQLDQ